MAAELWPAALLEPEAQRLAAGLKVPATEPVLLEPQVGQASPAWVQNPEPRCIRYPGAC